jgi:hypothetical protein
MALSLLTKMMNRAIADRIHEPERRLPDEQGAGQLLAAACCRAPAHAALAGPGKEPCYQQKGPSKVKEPYQQQKSPTENGFDCSAALKP